MAAQRVTEILGGTDMDLASTDEMRELLKRIVESVAEDLNFGVKRAAEVSKKRSGNGSWKLEQVTYESIRNQLRCLQGHRLRGTACCPEPGGLGFCDRCGRTVEAGEAVMHCWQCDYDVCKQCQLLAWPVM